MRSGLRASEHSARSSRDQRNRQTRLRRRVTPSPSQSMQADRIVRLALSAAFQDISGKYLYQETIRPANTETQDADTIRRPMRVSERAAGPKK